MFSSSLCRKSKEMLVANKFLRRLACLVVIIGVMIVALSSSFAVTSVPAKASATGCVRWGSVHIPEVGSLPLGQYCFTINGTGTTVNYTLGSINTPWIINFAEVVHFYDGYGKEYATFYGPVHRGYAYGFQLWKTKIHGTAKVGRVCGQITSSGVNVATACESIY
jgi:hypothetical protein